MDNCNVSALIPARKSSNGVQSPRLEPKRLVDPLCDPNPAVEGRPRRYSDGPAPTALLSEKPHACAN